MVSGRAIDTIKACRFCWMCRHLCPVGLATGREVHTPRAKALLLDMEQKGSSSLKECAEDMFCCCLCASCAENCETGYDPTVFIREARREIAARGLAPQKVMELIDKYMVEDGKPESERTAELLLYSGAQDTEGGREMKKAFCSLLEKAEIPYITWEKEPPDGNRLYDLIGETAEVRQMAEKCRDAVCASGAKRVVVLNPSSMRMFRQEYPSWGLEIPAEMETATSFAAKLLKEGKLDIKKTDGVAAYHDPCRLARDLEETEPPRELIRAMGYEQREMIQNRKLTKCCGGSVLNAHSPEVARLTAQGRLSDVERISVDMLITACPGCTDVLKKAEGKVKVKNLFVLLNEHT